jgi:hypothetical protein
LQNMVMQVFEAAMPEGLCDTFQFFGMDITDSPKRIGRRGSNSLTASLIAGLKIISTSVSTSAKRVLIRLWCFEFASCSSMKVPSTPGRPTKPLPDSKEAGFVFVAQQ